MTIADNGHHRERRHPALVLAFALAGIDRLGIAAQLVYLGSRIIHDGERRRPELTAAQSVAAELEPPAERGKRRKIGVAFAAGLSGLSGKARQSHRRWRKAKRQDASENGA